MGRLLNWLRREPHDAPARPGASAPVTRDVRGDGWHVRLDLTPQVLSLEIPEEETARGRNGERKLFPRCPDALGLVSASMLAVKAKLFDDGLYAAAEIALQPGKAALLAAVAGAAQRVAAAASLGGIDTPFDERGQSRVREFLADEMKSKPLGFYTWNDELRRIFQQDRMLQEELAPGEAAAIRAALRTDPALDEAYGAHLAFVEKLTNPFAQDKADLRRPGGTYFFPPSRSHEADLAMRLYGHRPIPEGFSLADEMVKRLRDGSLRVEPTDASGWYDLQTWALEALVLLDAVPEGARLKANAGYRAQLDELFKAVLALTRETHVKQLAMPPTGATMGGRVPEEIAWIQPGLTVEPVRTYYARRADGYDFVRHVLESSGRFAAMRRQTPDGPADAPLDEELAGITALFRGAAAVAGHELGMEAAPDERSAPFRRWAAAPDVCEDIRMMVPVFYDIGRRKVKVWVVLGWATRELRVFFATPPSVQTSRGAGEHRFVPEFHDLAYPVLAELYVSRLLDRDEFRAHCDRHKTAEQILRHL